MGFQSKKPLICCATKLENLTAPRIPKNKAPRLATSTTNPFLKPLKNPNPKVRVTIISNTLTLLNYFIFRK